VLAVSTASPRAWTRTWRREGLRLPREGVNWAGESGYSGESGARGWRADGDAVDGMRLWLRRTSERRPADQLLAGPIGQAIMPCK